MLHGLRGRHGRRRRPQQAPEPTYITLACRCDAHLFAHVHRPSRPPTNVIHMSGEAFWPWLKEQVIAAQKEKAAGEAQDALMNMSAQNLQRTPHRTPPRDSLTFDFIKSSAPRC